MKCKFVYLPLMLLTIFFVACKEDTAEMAPPPHLSVGLAEGEVINMKQLASTKTVNVSTNLENWDVVAVGEEVYDWCTVETKKDGTQSNIRFKVTFNNGVEVRKAAYSVVGEGVSPIRIDIAQLGSDPVILISIKDKEVNKAGEKFNFEVTTNVQYNVSTSANWLSIEDAPATKAIVKENYQITATANQFMDMRIDTVFVKSTDDQYPIQGFFTVQQTAISQEEAFPDDKLISIASAKLTYGNTYGSENVDRTFDGDYNTHYSSSRTLLNDSVIIDYTIASTAKKIDIVRLSQRANGDNNSIFGVGSIWYKTSADTDWQLAGIFNEARGTKIEQKVAIVDANEIRVCIKNTGGGAIALAEVELIELADRGDLSIDAQYFEDDVFSVLKSSTTKNDLSKLTNAMTYRIAKALLENKYNKEFRARAYNSDMEPWRASSQLAISNRSKYDNPTGILFVAGEQQIVFVGEMNRASLSMLIRDCREGGGEETITLKPGLNIFKSRVTGNGYIQYWTEDDTPQQPINIHFAYGHEIGFWDKRAGHTQNDWSRILTNAEKCIRDNGVTNGMMEVLGDKAQLINTVSAFRTHCRNVEETLEIMDSVIAIEYRMMGLMKNNAVPSNRTLCLRTWGGPPNWGGQSANFPNSEADMLTPQGIRNSVWLYGHELGHGNQIRPHMHMTGWGETTNNNYTQYAQYLLSDKTNLRLDHETCARKQGDSPSAAGGRFNAYLNEAHVVREPYLTQEGPDYKKGSMNGTGLRGDHFVKCVPLWQLTIYFMIAGEGNDWHRPDFWADVNWASIQDKRTNLSNGERYVNFMKRCIDASQLNLSTFFHQMGLLRVVDRDIDDYSVGRVTITAQDSIDIRTLGASYPDPSSPVISYISINAMEAFKNQVEVSGTISEGITWNTDKSLCTIAHNVWQNVVVFETYKGDELVDVAMVGTGDRNNTSTQVRYPKGSTRIEAVSWNGKRTLVYGQRL
ncbi:MAG: M60 family metallopeptidase [Marinifilaceae bacterium]